MLGACFFNGLDMLCVNFGDLHICENLIHFENEILYNNHKKDVPFAWCVLCHWMGWVKIKDHKYM